MEKKFLEYKQPIFAVNSMLNPGSYEVDFSFQLPMGLPSSMNIHDKSTRERPKAKVKYFVKTVLFTQEGSKNMKYK
jgi:hypothetical protein